MLWTCGRLGSSLTLAALCWGALGCSANVKAAVGPQGSHIITCGNGMTACVNKAQKICGDDEGYTIVEGVSRPKLLGGSSSSYRTMSEVGQLTVRCGMPTEEEEEAAQVQFKLPERTDAPIVPDEPIEPVEPAPQAVCTPGATQACVGPGACQGGQMCLESGKGFGPCDCGGSQTSAPIKEKPTAGAEGPSTANPGAGPKAPSVPGAAPEPTPLTK